MRAGRVSDRGQEDERVSHSTCSSGAYEHRPNPIPGDHLTRGIVPFVRENLLARKRDKKVDTERTMGMAGHAGVTVVTAFVSRIVHSFSVPDHAKFETASTVDLRRTLQYLNVNHELT
jgi:hypothetical protein